MLTSQAFMGPYFVTCADRRDNFINSMHLLITASVHDYHTCRLYSSGRISCVFGGGVHQSSTK